MFELPSFPKQSLHALVPSETGGVGGGGVGWLTGGGGGGGGRGRERTEAVRAREEGPLERVGATPAAAVISSRVNADLECLAAACWMLALLMSRARRGWNYRINPIPHAYPAMVSGPSACPATLSSSLSFRIDYCARVAYCMNFIVYLGI